MKIDLGKAVDEAVKDITHQVKARAYRAANELRSSALHVLKGERSGKEYRTPFTKKATYTASAPGEPPALRSGNLRMSWRPQTGSENTGKGLTVKPAITTDVKYAPILQEGTKDGRIAPRPFEEPIIEHAMPRILQIFKEPY